MSIKKTIGIFLLLLLIVSCSLPQGLAAPLVATVRPSGSAPTYTSAPRLAPTDTRTLAPVSSSTPTFTPSPSETPTQSASATQTGTPTLAHPTAISKANSNCLYGPATAYLYMYGLRPGGSADVQGRNYAGNWLWVRPADTKLLCWVSASSVSLTVEIKSLPVVNPPLQTNPAVKPPAGVHAARSGGSVTVQWSTAAPSVGLAYLIEASICSKGNLIDVVISTTALSYKLTDDKTCKQASDGQLRVQNKLGYSNAVKIPLAAMIPGSWQTRAVDAEGWRTLREGLRVEYQALGASMILLAHCAYHVGEIRQRLLWVSPQNSA